jgi:hypothetical protein
MTTRRDRAADLVGERAAADAGQATERPQTSREGLANVDADYRWQCVL